VSLTELIEDSPILQTNKAGVFIPLKKKRVNFEILINRLERLGIRGIVLNYSNLKDRKEFVKLGDECCVLCPPEVSIGTKIMHSLHK